MTDTPAYTLEFEDRDGYLFARVDGPEDTYDVSVAYWTEVEAECRRRGAKRLLVLEALEGNAEPVEMEQVVDALIAMGFRDIRVAYVDATEDAVLMVSAEIRATEAGLVGRVFRRVDEAERWLRADAAEVPGAADGVPPLAAVAPPTA